MAKHVGLGEITVCMSWGVSLKDLSQLGLLEPFLRLQCDFLPSGLNVYTTTLSVLELLQEEIAHYRNVLGNISRAHTLFPS